MTSTPPGHELELGVLVHGAPSRLVANIDPSHLEVDCPAIAQLSIPAIVGDASIFGNLVATELEESMADANVIISELEAAYHHYIEVFNREDAAGFVGCYHHPHAMLTGEQGMVVTNTEADHQRGYQRMMAALRDSGWGRSGIDRVQIWPFSESLAQLVADVTRYKKDGAVLEKLRASYMFRREGGAWKILAFSLVEAPFSGPGASR